MVDIALTEAFNDVAPSRGAALKRFGRSDARFRLMTLSAALLVVAIFIGIMVSLVSGAWPALHTFGWGFLTASVWNPVTEKFGAFAAIYGTVVSSALAMLIAVPLGIGIAIFLTELCPRPLKRPVGIAIELLAGVPSIIYGIWGLFVFAPFFQQTVEPWIIDTFGNTPFLKDIFAGPPYGIGTFTAALNLSMKFMSWISAVSGYVF
jgi:phosphate transport system permease protein